MITSVFQVKENTSRRNQRCSNSYSIYLSRISVYLLLYSVQGRDLVSSCRGLVELFPEMVWSTCSYTMRHTYPIGIFKKSVHIKANEESKMSLSTDLFSSNVFSAITEGLEKLQELINMYIHTQKKQLMRKTYIFTYTEKL